MAVAIRLMADAMSFNKEADVLWCHGGRHKAMANAMHQNAAFLHFSSPFRSIFHFVHAYAPQLTSTWNTDRTRRNSDKTYQSNDK